MVFKRGIGVGLVLLAASCSPKYEQNQTSLENCVEINAGEIGFVEERPIQSKKYTHCSALILDAGNCAVLTHALPLMMQDYQSDDFFSVRSEGQINAKDVVEKAVNELKRKGIKPGEYWAVVHAGEASAYQHIIEDLHKRNIPVKLANLDSGSYARMRTILWDPVNNKMIVKGKFPEETYCINKN